MSAATQNLKPAVGGTMRANQDLLQAALGDVIANVIAHLTQLDLVDEEMFLRANDTLKLALLRAKGITAEDAPTVRDELGHAYDLLSQMGIAVSVTINVQTAAPAATPKPVRDDRADILAAFLDDNTQVDVDPQAIPALAEVVPVAGIFNVRADEILVKKILTGDRGLGFVKDDVLATNLANYIDIWPTGGPLTILLADGSTTQIQVLSPQVKAEFVRDLWTLIGADDLDMPLVASAEFFNSGDVVQALQASGATNVVTNSQGLTAPKRIERTIVDFFGAATKLYRKRIVIGRGNHLWGELKHIILPAFNNAGVVSSIARAVGSDERPFQVLLNDPSAEYVPMAMSLRFFRTLTQAFRYFGQYDPQGNFNSYLPGLAKIGDQYCTDLANLAKHSPKPLNVSRGTLVGMQQALPSLLAYLEVNVQVGNTSVNVKLGVAATATNEWKVRDTDDAITRIHLQRLEKLMETHALKGNSTEAHITMEIDSIQAEVRRRRSF